MHGRKAPVLPGRAQRVGRGARVGPADKALGLAKHVEARAVHAHGQVGVERNAARARLLAYARELRVHLPLREQVHGLTVWAPSCVPCDTGTGQLVGSPWASTRARKRAYS